jgi:hypothetical protein
MDRTYTLAPFSHVSSRMLTALLKGTYLPLLGHVECPLALIVLHTLMYLSSNV